VSHRRILVAEDQTLIRLDLERLLGAAGYVVCGLARNGEEVVRLAADERPDVILLDIDMPLLDGLEAARQILAARPVPIVMLTAYGYGEVISRAIDTGVAGFVVKPFKESELLEALRVAELAPASPSGLASLVRKWPAR
jgi:AmiR/NasT family two-component response regulator